MPRAKQIRMTNGDLEGYVLRESVDAWERNGWTVADDGDSEGTDEVTEHPMESITEPGAQDPIAGDEGQAPASKTAAKKTTTRKAD